ncbi:ExeA family protein, partial [Arsukibacterium sp.]|uniref:ExeA family protein n=1 Tax=Arsukibacterium sp. TaxID=1977258 RepID=UPI002FD87CAE
GKQVILVIDEAQVMTDDTLETLRLLTNLETEQRKLLQVVLFGQPELDQRLAQVQLRQLRQRVTFSFTLAVMNAQQTEHYLSQRLQVAGAEHQLFSSGALEGLCRFSRGIPRLVNILAHKSLMLAYGEGVSEVSSRHVRYAAEDTDDVIQQTGVIRAYWRLYLLLGLLFAASGYAWYSR